MTRVWDRVRLVCLLAALPVAGCDVVLGVEDEGPVTTGTVRGTLSYSGPPPCLNGGLIEGAVVVMVYALDKLPPPEGLESTPISFATIPGAELFANIPRPADGPGSTKSKESLCPSVSASPINASTNWSVERLPPGQYQVRAFYSRQSRFHPLFDFANQPLAGDVPSGAIEVDIGVGIREGVALSLRGPLASSRPFFSIDYERSVSFSAPDPIVPGGPRIDKDFATNWALQRKKLTPAEAKSNGFVTFPQDHLSTSQTKGSCAGDKDPACDLFELQQASFPSLRLRFGFPVPPSNDAWLMKSAKPVDGARPYYGIDPKELVADIPTSGAFMLTRKLDAKGEPEILRENASFEMIFQIADIFPAVVLAKLAEDGEGNLALPPRLQTDPMVVLDAITLKDWEEGPAKGQGSMKATSQGTLAGGALTTADGTAIDPNHPLAKPTGAVLQDGLTALIRPAALCIYPQVDARGILVTPVAKDPNPDNLGATLVERAKLFALKGGRVKDVRHGCLPPGHYSVNVVYPSGQSWSLPNLSGYCAPDEECMGPNQALTGGFTLGDPAKAISGVSKDAGFPMRPMIKSQMLFQIDDTGKPLVAIDSITGRSFSVPQVVVIKPSPRCGDYKLETDFACETDMSCVDAPFSGVCRAGPADKKFCDYNADGKISTTKVWINNPDNEDTALDSGGAFSAKSGNGILDPGEDKNGNGKMDLKVPYNCSLPFAKFASLPAEKLVK